MLRRDRQMTIAAEWNSPTKDRWLSWHARGHGRTGRFGADFMALAEAYSPARVPATNWYFLVRVQAFENPHLLIFFESHVLRFVAVAGTQHKARQNGRAAEAAGHGRRSSEVDAFSFNIRERRRRGTRPCLKELFAIDGMRRVRRDQGKFGLSSVDDAENVAGCKAQLIDVDIAFHTSAAERQTKGLREVSSTIGGGPILRAL